MSISTLADEVHVTDISETAIDYQKNKTAEHPIYTALLQESPKVGAFEATVQDFTTKFIPNKFDVILNVKAFQGFAPSEMTNIADVHFDSMKPGGTAFFEVQNVQGEQCDILEASLVGAGFHIPFYEQTLAYRKALRETGIPHVFILGMPMIRPVAEYADKELHERATKVLRSIAADHQINLKAEHDSGTAYGAPDARTACVIYNTG